MNSVLNISQQFHNWYEMFQGSFVKIGLQLGYQQEEVHDFINQFFLELLEKKIDPESIRNPQAYLTTAFRRKLIDHYRLSGKNHTIVLQASDEIYSEQSIQDVLERTEANTELIARIRVAYEKLPSRCRKVIDLKFYHGMSTEEISLQSGLTKRSVNNNLFEGVRLLREELNHSAPGIHIAALFSCLATIIATLT
jgi:RNA polymerase sigma factor (sigma-70 family)